MPANPNYHPFLTKPMEVTGWWDESLSWHEGVYINSSLNSPFPTMDFEGPDAERFLEKYIVNSMRNRPVGKGMHAIFCTDAGKIASDGIILKRGEHSYRALCVLAIGALAELEKGNFDVTFTDKTGTMVLYQFCGPRSLELMEAVTGQDLHGLKFMCYTETSIDGMPVEILRVGMAGSLGYEIHCRTEDSVAIYQAVFAKGEQFGLRQLGWQSYRNAHTEGGFPQSSVHFWYADYAHLMDATVPYRTRPQDPGAVYAGIPDGSTVTDESQVPLFGKTLFDGSYSDEPFINFCVNPYEVGWAKMVKFDHDFVGRAALERIAAEPYRQVVTLVWSKEDVADVWMSIFDEGEPYKRMDAVADLMPYGEFEYIPQFNVVNPTKVYMELDHIMAGDEKVGFSSNRMFSPYYRKMISMAIVEPQYSQVGTQVEVLWGNPGTRQKRIRATVERFPLIDTDRNEKLDVSSIPSGVGK